MATAMLRVLVAAVVAAPAVAQCGPGGTMAYPPGQTVCPPPPGGGNGGGGSSPPPGGSSAPPPGGTSPPPTGGGGGGMGTGGEVVGTDTMPLCPSPPCGAALLGRIAATTVAGSDARSGASMPVGEDIYGPFEAGFGSSQDTILEHLGCSSGALGHVAGGIDTLTAQQMVAYQCQITLPRLEGNTYFGLLDECGGHTGSYHFHESFSCLYTAEVGSGHSAQVGQGGDGRYLYGKWEDFSASELPKLDACGGHFGLTPDSGGAAVYHYHVQDTAPFTFGCFGPISVGGDNYKMVTLAECRALYDGCGDNDIGTVTTSEGSKPYDFWCPCYDRDGSNVAAVELAVFDGPENAYTCSGAICASTQAVATPSTPTGGASGAPPGGSTTGAPGGGGAPPPSSGSSTTSVAGGGGFPPPPGSSTTGVASGGGPPPPPGGSTTGAAGGGGLPPPPFSSTTGVAGGSGPPPPPGGSTTGAAGGGGPPPPKGGSTTRAAGGGGGGAPPPSSSTTRGGAPPPGASSTAPRAPRTTGPLRVYLSMESLGSAASTTTNPVTSTGVMRRPGAGHGVAALVLATASAAAGWPRG